MPIVILIVVCSVALLLVCIYIIPYYIRDNTKHKQDQAIASIKGDLNCKEEQQAIEQYDSAEFIKSMTQTGRKLLCKIDLPDKKFLRVLKKYENFVLLNWEELMKTNTSFDDLALTTLINISISSNDAVCSAALIKYKQQLQEEK